MTRNTKLLTALVVGLSVAAGTAQAGVVVGFDDAVSTVHVGDTFEVRIVMTTDEQILGWGLDLTIEDESIASLDGPPEVGPLWDAFSTPDGDGLGGLAFPDPVGPGNDFLLATLTFIAHEIGITDLQLSYTDADLTEGFATNKGTFAETTFNAGQIIVVPVPGGFVVLLAAMAPGRRRRR